MTSRPPQPARAGALSAPYWEGCSIGELRVQRCDGCGHHQFHPRPQCVACGRPDPGWTATGGRGRVVTWTRVHVPLGEAWADQVPYWVALVRLEEGPTLMTNLIDVDDVHVGMRVEVRFHTRPDGTTLPVFAPSRASSRQPERED